MARACLLPTHQQHIPRRWTAQKQQQQQLSRQRQRRAGDAVRTGTAPGPQRSAAETCCHHRCYHRQATNGGGGPGDEPPRVVAGQRGRQAGVKRGEIAVPRAGTGRVGRKGAHGRHAVQCLGLLTPTPHRQALRASPLGKILFSVLDRLFPVFKVRRLARRQPLAPHPPHLSRTAPPRHTTPRHATPRHTTPHHATPHHTTPRQEPNWFDVYDPPLTSEENLELPYFDGFDFVNRCACLCRLEVVCLCLCLCLLCLNRAFSFARFLSIGLL